MSGYPWISMITMTPEISAILGDPSLSSTARVDLLRRLESREKANLLRLNKELANNQAQQRTLERQLESYRDVAAWAEKSYRREPNDCSRLHKLDEAWHVGKVIAISRDEILPSLWRGAQIFVVQHDWAAAFNNAQDYDAGEFRLPYEHCVFEFRVSGREVMVICAQDEGEAVIAACVQSSDGYWWLADSSVNKWGLFQFLWKQVRAISIALDAEVATQEIVRAPTSLNAKRERKGLPPVHDFVMVTLRGRSVREYLDGPHGTHRSPRLHFRRGHWRRYEMHKTWIRWTLVGNPALGFLDKAYKL
jgi:hypothetical protein